MNIGGLFELCHFTMTVFVQIHISPIYKMYYGLRNDLFATVVLIHFWQQNSISKTIGFGGWGRRKIIPAISTVSNFKPKVKIPRLQ